MAANRKLERDKLEMHQAFKPLILLGFVVVLGGVLLSGCVDATSPAITGNSATATVAPIASATARTNPSPSQTSTTATKVAGSGSAPASTSSNPNQTSTTTSTSTQTQTKLPGPEAVTKNFFAAWYNEGDKAALQYLDPKLQTRLQNGDTIGKLLGVQNTTSNVALTVASNNNKDAIVNAVLRFGTDNREVQLYLTNLEGKGWRIAGITALAPKPGQSTEVVIKAFFKALPDGDKATLPYLWPRLRQEVENGASLAKMLGVQNLPASITIQAATQADDRFATIPVVLHFASEDTKVILDLAAGDNGWEIASLRPANS